jgi:c-di-GMP-related signal transduction protein
VGDSNRQADYFFMGLLSCIDILLRRPMRMIVAELPIAADVGGALQGEKGRMRDVLDIVIRYEQGQWDEFAQLAQKLSIEEKKISEMYLKALLWSHELPHGQLTKMATETAST